MDLRPRPSPPRVGPTTRGYRQFCPVAVACEVFAERRTPLILREMFCGSRRFGSEGLESRGPSLDFNCDIRTGAALPHGRRNHEPGTERGAEGDRSAVL